MRPIDADAYMEKVRREAKAMPQKQGKTFVTLSEWIMEKTPSIERNCGEWIYGEHDVAMCDGYRCDRCGFFVPWDYEHKSIDFINDYNFCPNCGADMHNCSEKLNNSTISKMEQVDKGINVPSKNEL